MNDFLFGAWVSPSPRVKDFKIMKDCLINTGFILNRDNTYDYILKTVKVSSKVGVNVFIPMENNLNSYLYENEELDKYKSVIGYNIFDEPKENIIGDIEKVKEKFLKVHKDKLFYINLLPSYGPIDDFKKYVEDYAILLKSSSSDSYLSLDHYPIRKMENEKTYLSNTWLYDVETLVDIAYKYDLKPHFFIQAMSFGGYAKFCMYDLDLEYEDISLQAYTYLAYGSKGFTYFCYDSPTSPEFRADQTGLVLNSTKTNRWYMAKRVNSEINYFLDEYLNHKYIGTVKKVGTFQTNNPFEGLSDFSELNTKYIKNIDSTVDTLIGVFELNNKESYIITPFMDVRSFEKEKVKFKFNKPGTITLYKNKKKIIKYVKNQYTLNLKKGMGVYMVFEGE